MTEKPCRKCEDRPPLPGKAICGWCLERLNETAMRDNNERN